MQPLASTQSGNTSNLATFGGISPVGRCLIINHDVRADAHITVGDSSDQTAVYVSDAGSFVVNSGVQFTYRGNIHYDGPITLGEGVTFTADPTQAPNPSAYEILLRPTKDFPRASFFSILGTSANPTTLRTLRTNGNEVRARFTLAGHAGMMGWFDLQNYIMEDMGGLEFWDKFVSHNAVHIRCGPVKQLSNLSASMPVSLKNHRCKDSIGPYNVKFNSTSDRGADGVREMISCYFDKGIGREGWESCSVHGFTVRDVVAAGDSDMYGVADTWDRTVIVKTGGATRMQHAVSNTFVASGRDFNPHYLQIAESTPNNAVFEGLIFEHISSNPSGDGDGFIIPDNGPTSFYSLRNTLALPNANGSSSGTIASTVAHANPARFEVLHPTFWGGPSFDHGLYFGEGATQPSGTVPTFKSACYYDTQVRGNHLITEAIPGQPDNIVDPAGCTHNNAWNAYATTAFPGKSSQGTPYGISMSGATPGANDKNVDPQYVDPSRNFAKYATQHGRTASVDNTLAALFEDPTRIGSLLAWVRDGFRPQNEALRGAGHDGKDIGAVPMATVVVTSPPPVVVPTPAPSASPAAKKYRLRAALDIIVTLEPVE